MTEGPLEDRLLDREIADINDPGWTDEMPDEPHPNDCECYSCDPDRSWPPVIE